MICRVKQIVLISFLLSSLVNALNANAQQTVTFVTKDGLTVTADHYVADVDYPYILLLHQAGFSRGEYREIAPKLTKLGYNCLAIDQRSGYEACFVPNLTAARAVEKGLSQAYVDAIPDIEAALAYIKQRCDKPIVLWGSSYSASLALMLAPRDLRVGALVVFSPGEYFPGQEIAASAAKVSVPVFVTSSHGECEQIRQVCAGIKPELLTVYCPTMPGEHGSKALWETNPCYSDYWLAVMMFFSRLKNQK